MSQTDKQLWIERITRALAELKKEPPADHRSSAGVREARQSQPEDK